jgi:sugar phosphate isomerase/epimerase
MSDTRKTSRRTFLGAAAGTAVAAGTLGPAPAGAQGGGSGGSGGGDIPERRIGIQLFTVRDLLADNELDLPGTFEMLSDAGYALVEVGGTYDSFNFVDRTAAEFKAIADEYGLKPEGSHVPGGGNTWRTNRAQIFADAQTLGLKYVGLASPPQGTAPTHAAYAALAEEFNTWGAEAREHGLKFYFHNHPPDFTLDGGTPIYDTLLAVTDPRLVYFELDIAWIEAGGQSAFEYIRRHGSSRFPLFHVKDLTFTEPPYPPNVTPRTPGPNEPRRTPANVNLPNRPYWLTDVGKGDIDFAKIFSALRDLGDHVYHVEHDDAPDDETAALPPGSPQGTPLTVRPRNPAGSANTAWVSRKYLAELGVPGRH